MRAVIGQPLRPWDRPRRAANVKAATRRKRWPTASLDIATATRSAARTRGWPETRRVRALTCSKIRTNRRCWHAYRSLIGQHGT